MPSVDAWTHEEMILVLNLYLKLPFGKMDRRNPDVIHLANIIGRTPNAVALRLVNYASYDPQLQRRGISGMAHGGKKCGEMFWNVGGNLYLCGINAARLLTNNLRHMDDLEPIKRKIYVIRGQRVMLDYDASRCQFGALNLSDSRYAAIQKRREAAGEKLPPPDRPRTQILKAF